jgi:L-alanine-DL-glutamate epimerase-like enolase superfamily enzyme
VLADRRQLILAAPQDRGHQAAGIELIEQPLPAWNLDGMADSPAVWRCR